MVPGLTHTLQPRAHDDECNTNDARIEFLLQRILKQNERQVELLEAQVDIAQRYRCCAPSGNEETIITADVSCSSPDVLAPACKGNHIKDIADSYAHIKDTPDAPVEVVNVEVESAGELRLSAATSATSWVLDTIAWQPDVEATRSDLADGISELPFAMPNLVKVILVLSATLTRQQSTKGLRWVVHLYKSLFLLSLANDLISELGSILIWTSAGHELDVSYAPKICYIVFISAVIPVFWLVWSSQYGGGASMALLHHVSARAFPWHDLKGSIRKLLIAMLVWVIQHLLSHRRNVLKFPVNIEGGVHPFLVIVVNIAMYGRFISAPAIFCTFFSLVWLVFFTCALHQHDLRCYSGAVFKTIENEKDRDKALRAFNKLEITLTARFLFASKTWVRTVVYYFLSCGCIWIICLLFLLSSRDMLSSMIVLFAMLLLFCVCAALVVPMASVHETFEFDVVRALNTPLIVSRAQQYFGQQLIHHIRALDWGFRFGGTAIKMSLVMRIIGIMAVTIATALFQIVMSKLSI